MIHPETDPTLASTTTSSSIVDENTFNFTLPDAIADDSNIGTNTSTTTTSSVHVFPIITSPLCALGSCPHRNMPLTSLTRSQSYHMHQYIYTWCYQYLLYQIHIHGGIEQINIKILDKIMINDYLRVVRAMWKLE